jgi:hypothetical protein
MTLTVLGDRVRHQCADDPGPRRRSVQSAASGRSSSAVRYQVCFEGSAGEGGHAERG